MGITDQEFEAMRARMEENAQVIHGLNCNKVAHILSDRGYLHDADDDTSYDVDGCLYCGRCHEAITFAGRGEKVPVDPHSEAPVRKRAGASMNKTEQRFAQYLDGLKLTGGIKTWWFESIRFKIGYDCWLKPDFLVENAHGELALYDTKGTKRSKTGATKPYAEEDAIVKARAIADKFPIPLYFAWLDNKTGEWNFKRM